jgi:hypothetical protein
MSGRPARARNRLRLSVAAALQPLSARRPAELAGAAPGARTCAAASAALAFDAAAASTFCAKEAAAGAAAGQRSLEHSRVGWSR